jgi:hypothetical protein
MRIQAVYQFRLSTLGKLEGGGEQEAFDHLFFRLPQQVVVYNADNKMIGKLYLTCTERADDE